jgi:hypothetical protein
MESCFEHEAFAKLQTSPEAVLNSVAAHVGIPD